ncbi:hypothetical protein BJ508DRAFT_328751 [Ascobolus immersus RN42]|uniref:Nudix hydrolase domain-containing protein n=1 Tax=Ascobolus immersus RN42 TaxID=1160509 RepID=A0A3N4I4L3_ASCIM|nr:hypothetical protein BJ508DRAFT_328751 [Ascobolus immersus RN42]
MASATHNEFVQGDIPQGISYIAKESKTAITEMQKSGTSGENFKVRLISALDHPEHKPKRCLNGTSVFVFWEDKNIETTNLEERWYVLLGVRKGSHGAKTLALPGGHIERCEYFEKTSRREVVEETGIEIEDVRRMVSTDDVMYEVERGSDDWPLKDTDGKLIYKDIKHYETNFLGAKIIGEHPEKPKPVVMEPKKCYGWEWVRCDHVHRIFALSDLGRELYAHCGVEPPNYPEIDEEWDTLLNTKLFKEHTEKGKTVPELFLPLTNLWLQNGLDYKIYESYQKAVPENIVYRPLDEINRIKKYKAGFAQQDPDEDHRAFMRKVYKSQLKEMQDLMAALEKEIGASGLDLDVMKRELKGAAAPASSAQKNEPAKTTGEPTTGQDPTNTSDETAPKHDPAKDSTKTAAHSPSK